VKEVGEFVDLAWRWRLRWRRVRYEWESVIEADLVMCISRANMNRKEKDIQVWGFDESGIFSVNSTYECLVKHVRGTHQDAFKYLWKAKAFPNVTTTT